MSPGAPVPSPSNTSSDGDSSRPPASLPFVGSAVLSTSSPLSADISAKLTMVEPVNVGSIVKTISNVDVAPTTGPVVMRETGPVNCPAQPNILAPLRVIPAGI